MIRINLHRKAKRNSRPWAIGVTLTLIATLAGTLSGAHEMIIDGTEVSPEDYRAVVSLKVSSTTSSTTFEESCTGFLVAPKLILTAAHCLVDRTTVEWITNRVHVAGKDGRDFRAARFQSYPGYVVPSKDNAPEQNVAAVRTDIGYMLLNDEVPETEIAYLPVYVTEDSPSMEKLEQLNTTLVGYGPTKWNSSGSYPDAKQAVKHSGLKTVTEVENGYIKMAGEEGGGLPGDSGGPVFATVDGKLQVVALDEGYTSSTKTVPILDKKGNPKLDKKGNPKTKEVSVDYAASLATMLTRSNLCWVEADSGVTIPGVDCTAYWNAHPPKAN